MSDVAIKVEGLGKRFMIGKREAYKTARETVTSVLGAPFRMLSRKKEDPETILWALKDVNFEIKRGEAVGIIGRNGAGKSTLLKVLSRITDPTEGQIAINGRVGSLLEVGTGFHPELTGRENIFMNGAILGMRRAEIIRKFDEIVAFAEVDRFIDTPVKRYSSGMYTRLAFAVAAHLEPEILIIDEVLAVGDAQFQKKCLGKMQDVTHRGRTVLFVSHNMGAVRTFCGRALWLSQGQLHMDGPCLQVIDPYVRDTVKAWEGGLDLSKTMRGQGFGQQLKITRIVVNNGGKLVNGEPVKVAFDYEAYCDVEGVSFSIGFSSFEGTRIVTIDTDYFGERRALRRDDRGTVELHIDELILTPGDYVLDVGARSGDMYGLDYLASCGSIDVIPGPRTPSHLVNASAQSGIRLGGSSTWHDVERVVS